ncbi:MAG: signal recognition particle-docking protein FtsY [Candidatus Onthovivens sp.]|nr:signal recognition particle-docking protein FtsY [Candidatus Onthovivens sp.]
MGLFKFLKDKFKKKEENSLENEKTLESVKKYDEGLAKSRENFSKRLKALNKEFKSKKLDDNYFNNLEEILIEADCGVEFTLNTIEKLVEIVKKEKLTDLKEINERLISLMFNNYNDDSQNEDDITLKEGLNVFLVVGVNGVGKTTSIAKLANFYLKQNKKVLLVAGDTFRAGAKEQLTIWANRLNINIITGKENEDPASVSYAGVKYAKENNYDLVILDTAGRLQNKVNLMNELNKIKRVINKISVANIYTYLVLDASTGQNGVLQATAFKDVVDINGIIITKMDGTSKGGIILAIKDSLNIKVNFIGLGEKLDDLEVFDLNKYLYGLCKELIEDE